MKNKVTGKKAATASSAILRGVGTKKQAKTAAASDLAQRPSKKGRA